MAGYGRTGRGEGDGSDHAFGGVAGQFDEDFIGAPVHVDELHAVRHALALGIFDEHRRRAGDGMHDDIVGPELLNLGQFGHEVGGLGHGNRHELDALAVGESLHVGDRRLPEGAVVVDEGNLRGAVIPFVLPILHSPHHSDDALVGVGGANQEVVGGGIHIKQVGGVRSRHEGDFVGGNLGAQGFGIARAPALEGHHTFLHVLGIELFGLVNLVSVIGGNQVNLATIDAAVGVEPIHVSLDAFSVRCAHVRCGAGQVEDGSHFDGGVFPFALSSAAGGQHQRGQHDYGNQGVQTSAYHGFFLPPEILRTSTLNGRKRRSDKHHLL